MKKYGFLIFVLFAVLSLFYGYEENNNITGMSVFDNVYDNVSVVDVVFSPSNYSEDLFLKYIGVANYSLYCALYDIKEERIVDLMNNKYSSGIEVKVVSDYKNSLNKNSKIKDLKMNYVLNKNSHNLMHNKFCVIDDSFVIVGSTNPTYNGFFRNNNNFVVLKSKKVNELFRDEFDELFSGVFGDGKKSDYNLVNGDDISVEIYFCPEDFCEDEVLEELEKANNSVYVEAFSFTDKNIANELINLRNKGIEVKVVMEKRQISKYSVYNYLKENNVSVVYDSNPYNMHNKVIIIDNETVIAGSPNFSKNGMFRNDESMVVIHNNGVAEEYSKEFFNIF